MKRRKHIIAVSLVAAMCAQVLCGAAPATEPATVLAEEENKMETFASDSEWKYGLGDAIGFNESTYKTIDKKTGNDNWKEGSVTANGEIGFIESCDPREDVFIFNNTKIVTDNQDIYETPVISNILDAQRKGAIYRNDFPWVSAVDSYASSQYGTGWGLTWSRPYQPAAQYRLINNDYSQENSSLYNRYTNYETGEVGVQWKDNSGNEWNRRSFASRSDEIIVTYIEAPEGKELDITLTMDHMVEMRNLGTVWNRPDTDYVVTEDDNGYAFGMVAKYPIWNRKGSKNVQPTKFSAGGWGTATRVVTTGNIDYNAARRNIDVPSNFQGGTINANDPRLTVTGTNSVMLITKVDRIDDGCRNVNDVKENLYNALLEDIDGIIDDKGIASDEEGYQKLLEPHAAIHGGMFNNVRIDLCQTDADRADRQLTNSQLIAKQNSNRNVLNKAFLERIYNNGRFGLICASGYATARLGAIWNGAFNPEWSGDYTLDANTNLQVSGINTGNMQEATHGYINFIVRMVEDWDDDAHNIYGMEDAIKAPPRVDGTGEAGSYHFMEGYPHIYVNGITDWLIIPIYEYWQCYGNQQIPVGKDVDIERNREVLDYSDEDIERITSTGYMDLLEDILYPMVKKTMNFWLQYVDGRYYTDGSGYEHVDDGTTIEQAIANGDTNCKYLFTPGYSPENTPGQWGGNSKYAVAYNTTMDISAARDTLFMARSLVDILNPEDKDELLDVWADFESKIPDYLYADSGELKEWATPKLNEQHGHRHVSHAYPAWPGYESQTDDNLRVGIITAMDKRSAAYGGQEASESHGPTHKALVEARLKNVIGFENVLKYLLTSNYQYSTMMTSHNANHGSTYCTDSAFGIMGALNESLLYSNTGVIEVLPTLLSDALTGSVTGLRARTNAVVDVEWDINNWTVSATVKSDEDNNVIKVKCGQEWGSATVNGVEQNISIDPDDMMPYVQVNLMKGQSIKIDFSLADIDTRVSIKANVDSTKAVAAGTTVKFTSQYTFSRTMFNNGSWSVTDLAGNDAGVSVSNGSLTFTDALKGKTVKVSCEAPNGIKSNEIVFHVAGDSEQFGVQTGFAEDALGVYITNDGAAKKLSLVWAGYDAEGKLVGTSVKNVDAEANGFVKTEIVGTWPVESYTSTLYVWDQDTHTPLQSEIKIR